MKSKSLQFAALWGFLLASCLLLPASAFSQAYVRVDNILLDAQGKPMAGATVAVCTQPAVTTTQPCSPLATIYSDPAGVNLLNPITTDGLGNYHFYVSPGTCGRGLLGCTIQWYGGNITPGFNPDQTPTAGAGCGSQPMSVAAGTCYSTEQAAMTGSAGGVTQLPPTYNPADIVLGTQINSGNGCGGYCSNSSSQPDKTNVVDYRFGNIAESFFNPGSASQNTANASAHSIIGNYTKFFFSYPQQITVLDVEQNFYDGGRNINQGGVVRKDNIQTLNVTTNSWTEGQHIGLTTTTNGYGYGDNLPFGIGTNCWGGSNAGSDEGCEAMDMQVKTGNVEYTAAISSGGATGATSLTLSPSAGTGTEGSGRWLVDETTGTYSTGTVTTIAGSNPVVYTFSGATVPNSAITASTNSISALGPGTLNIPSTTGITANTTQVSVSDSASYECVVPTAVSTNASITAVFRWPHPSGAVVAWGGWACDIIKLTPDDVAAGSYGPDVVTNTLHYGWPIIASSSGASTANVWMSTQSVFNRYNGRAARSTGSSAFVVYPAANITSVQSNGGLNNVFTLTPNRNTWNNGDTVAEFLAPNQIVSVGQWNVVKLFPDIGSSSVGGNGINYYRDMTAGDCLWCVSNNTPSSYYNVNNLGGQQGPPNAFAASGVFDKGLWFPTAPGTAIYEGCPANGCPGHTTTLALVGNNSIGTGFDTIQYDGANGRWFFSVGGSAFQYSMDQNGNFTVPAPSANAGIKFTGVTSGSVLVHAQSVAGTPTIDWGTTSGTPMETCKDCQAVQLTTANMGPQSGATLTAITNMSWSIQASTNYKLDCEIPITWAASATVAFGLVGPGTPTSYSLVADGPLGAAGAYAQISTLAQAAWVSTTTSASGAVNSTQVANVHAMIQNGSTSGTLTLDTAADGTHNITVLANAACTLQQQN